MFRRLLWAAGLVGLLASAPACSSKKDDELNTHGTRLTCLGLVNNSLDCNYVATNAPDKVWKILKGRAGNLVAVPVDLYNRDSRMTNKGPREFVSDYPLPVHPKATVKLGCEDMGFARFCDVFRLPDDPSKKGVFYRLEIDVNDNVKGITEHDDNCYGVKGDPTDSTTWKLEDSC